MIQTSIHQQGQLFDILAYSHRPYYTRLSRLWSLISYEVIIRIQRYGHVYLESEGVRVIGAWDEVGVDTRASAELA